MTVLSARRRDRGFSLVELLIVVAIIGIIAVLAIPNLISAIQRSRQSRTMADLRMISEGVEAYQNDHSSYPVVGNGTVADLDAHLEIYIRKYNQLDGWGDRYQFCGGCVFHNSLDSPSSTDSSRKTK